MRMQYLRQVRSSADRLAGTTVRGRNEAVPTAPFEPMIDDILMMRPQPRATMPSHHDLSRQKFIEWFANREPCLVAMEACSAAHYWARQLRALGHEVRLIAPQFVAAYRKGGTRVKNDAVDAEAICEAASRPHMRFVPVKTPDHLGIGPLTASALIATVVAIAITRCACSWVRARNDGAQQGRL